jgi:ATP:corrinoid adenosyltransferase
LGIKDVIKFLDNLPEKTDVVLTRRYAPKQLIEKADFVNIIEDVKAQGVQINERNSMLSYLATKDSLKHYA